MRKKRTIILLLSLLIMSVLMIGCGRKKLSDESTYDRVKRSDTIVWGVKNDTKLFGLMNIDTRQVEGFDIDIAKALTKEILGSPDKAKFVEVTSKTRIPLLKNGNIDAIIATMTISDERKKQVDFSDIYFKAGQSLLVKKGSDIKSVEDLTGEKTVLAVKGSTSADNIRKAAPNTKVLELENYAEAFTALQSGQGDAMTTDNSILMGMAADNPDYVLTGGNFTNEPYGMAINKAQKSFQESLNKALEKIKSDGTYNAIYREWFDKDPE